MKMYCEQIIPIDATAKDIKIAEDAKKIMEKLCPKTCNLCE